MKMTQPQGQEQSHFNQRSDAAATLLKGDLSRQLSAMTGQQVELPPTPVAVNEQGRPVGMEQLPPEGSYARQAMEQQKLEQQRAQAQAQHQRATDPQAFQQPEAVPPSSPHDPAEQLSSRAQERISTLVEQLRQKDREYQQLQSNQAQQAQSVEQLQAQLNAAQSQMSQMMEQHMENLDPETRAQIMADARIRQQVALSEQRILQTLQPRLEALQVRNDQLEKVRLGGTYGGYDPQVHDSLIDEFRRANPHCSIEQAFRAVATPEEIRPAGVRPANAPPPAVPPGNGSTAPRYIPQQTNQPDPVMQMREDANRAAQLARSLDPDDQKAAQRLFHKNLAERLGMSLPGT